MSKQVIYKGLTLMPGSTALELWQNWQKDKTSERNKIQKKLDDLLKDVEARSKDVMERYK